MAALFVKWALLVFILSVLTLTIMFATAIHQGLRERGSSPVISTLGIAGSNLDGKNKFISDLKKKMIMEADGSELVLFKKYLGRKGKECNSSYTHRADPLTEHTI